MRPEVVVEEIAEALRELGAREPGLVRDGERVLDERELAALLFGSDARVSPRSLTADGAPEWFETRVAVHVDAAWLSEAEARSVLDRLRAMPVRVTKARVDASAALDPPKLRFVLVLELLRHEKPRPPPPAPRAVKRRNAGESLGPNRMACSACGAIHVTFDGRKGYPGDERDTSTTLCLDCGRERLSYEHFGSGGFELDLEDP
jgi:hypothetical protein